MATFHEWDSPLPLGSHHLSKAFVREGWDVAHVSSAISPPQLLRSPREFRQRMGRYKRSGVLRMDGHLWTYMPFAVLTPQSAPILRTKVVHRNWQRTTIPDVVATLASRGFGAVDILYIDTPTQAFWLDFGPVHEVGGSNRRPLLWIPGHRRRDSAHGIGTDQRRRRCCLQRASISKTT